MEDTRQQLLDNVMAVVKELEGGYENGAYDWLEEQLNIEGYSIHADGDFKGGEVLCSFGGPNIWVDTADETVHGAWGSDSFTRRYEDKIGLHEVLEECYNSLG